MCIFLFFKIKLFNHHIMQSDNIIQKISICTVVEEIFGEDFWTNYFSQRPILSYEAQCAAVDKWCKERNYMLYERPRESFFEWEAVQLAEAGNFAGVVLSDLS